MAIKFADFSEEGFESSSERKKIVVPFLCKDIGSAPETSVICIVSTEDSEINMDRCGNLEASC
jgi:hypothetical protein